MRQLAIMIALFSASFIAGTRPLLAQPLEPRADSPPRDWPAGGVARDQTRALSAGDAAPHPPTGAWRSVFTLPPNEGTAFTVDTSAIVAGGGVPVVSVTPDGRIILTSAGLQQLRAFEVGADGRSYTPTTVTQRGPDGGAVYLPDGRLRFLGEEPAPGNTPQRHKSRVVSWISADGLQWTREAGVRYQPGSYDDSIASVVSVIQLRDSLWRMYFVGDWYRTNGTRTALSSDWGLTWRQEATANILRRGDVDPHPVYLSDGRYRLYFRTGMGKPPEQAGVGYCDSDDGLRFDTSRATMLIADSDLPAMLKLDPAVIRLPGGQVVCYIGAAPSPGQVTDPRLIAAWGRKPASVAPPLQIRRFALEQNYPNPFNAVTTVRFALERQGPVRLAVFSLLGQEVEVLAEGVLPAGTHSATFQGANMGSGSYVCRLTAEGQSASRRLTLIR